MLRGAASFCLCLMLLVWNSCASHDWSFGAPHSSGQGNPLATTCGQHSHSQVYVSTIDGGLTSLDEHGHTLWTYSASNPLFFSSLSHVENGETVSGRIIPSLDRGIYQWDGGKLSQLPFSADDLIDHSHILEGRHSILAGARANDVVGVNIHTGKPIYECTHEKCRSFDNQSLIQRMDVLNLSISRITVREANDLTGEEMWNFTVGDMELMLIEGEGGEEGQETGEQSCNQFKELDWEIHVDALAGLLYSTPKSDSEHRLWEVQLGVPVVRAWFLDGGRLETLSLSHTSALVHPSLMMLHYNNQYYLQPVHVQRGEGHSELATSERQQSLEPALQQLQQMHFLLEAQFSDAGSSASFQETSLVSYNSDTFQELCTAGPYGLAVYFYVDPLPHEVYSSCKSHDSGDGGADVCSVPPDSTPSESSRMQWLMKKLFSVVLFGVFALLCNKLHRYVMVHRQRSSSSSSTTDAVTDDEFPLVNSIHRHSSLTDSATTPVVQMPSSPSSSTETMVPSLSRTDSLPEPRVLPRFGSDYELKGRLGKGGFGVVYHVQNKTDGGEYAVKRIKLPGKKAAREKVMREVRALAQLDHARIVRYFNSWVEKAPVGWNEMEEWMSLSRKSSFIQDYGLSTTAPTTQSSPSGSSLIPPPLARLGGHSVRNISPCPSFNSLNHSTIHSEVPPLTTDSRSSSFVIEFKEDSQNREEPTISSQATWDLVSNATTTASGGQDGCFSRAQDELSSTGSESQLTEDKDEQRDSIADLAVEPPTYLFIQMQLCKKESLKDWLKSNITNRCHGKVMHFFDQILDAVMYVHGKGMMHRDLKPSNIFFSLEGNIKVGDFGLVTSSAYGGLHNSHLALKGLEEQLHRQQHTGNLGSHFYMSPELISGWKYNHKVDIFSLGVIFFELHHPFDTEMERAKVLEDVRQYQFPSNFETRLPVQAELVKWLMAPHPNDRPVVEDIYNSAKFRQLQDNVMETIPKL